MKRFTIILFTIIYASVTLGVNLNLHYCGGELASVSVALPNGNCCCDDSDPTSECCDNAQLTVQMDVDQLMILNTDLQDLKFVASSIFNLDLRLVQVESDQVSPNLRPNPPPSDGIFRRIEMGSLTFYG